MKPINLFLMDMSHAGNTSGVDRYMGIVLKGLEDYPFIHIHWIHLRHDASTLFHFEEQTPFYTKITIPLPQQFNEIIAEKFWIDKYNEQIFRVIAHLFKDKDNCIIHIHTLNLIDLAIFIRRQTGCKVITQLHCIPWKGLYNGNIRRFNELYNLADKGAVSLSDRGKFVTNHSEIQSYEEADSIICVTRCAKDFLKNIMAIPSGKIAVIPNGMNDFNKNGGKKESSENEVLKLLYVGVLSESKGLKYILEAMRKVQQKGYNVCLTVAGKVNMGHDIAIKKANSDLSLNILGRISFEALMEQYILNDIGIIASLQEQSSYVAIEMAMFGLPVITTAVDGLDEMFSGNVNALKVNTRFSNVFGLSADTDMMADKIITLITDKRLRMQLGRNVRELYEKEHSLQRMMQQTVSVYQKMAGGTEDV